MAKPLLLNPQQHPITVPPATSTSDGAMTGEDKAKLNNLAPFSSYLVGPVGSGAPYTSINAAIAAAVADGASYLNPKTVGIMSGTYVENVTLPDGINLVGIGGNISSTIDGYVQVATVSGSGIVIGSINGITISPTTNNPGRASLQADAGVFFFVGVRDCAIYSTAFDHPAVQITGTGAGEQFDFNDTTIVGYLSTTYTTRVIGAMVTFDDSTIESQSNGGGATSGALFIDVNATVKCYFCDLFVASSASALDVINIAAGGGGEFYYCRITDIAIGHCVNVAGTATVLFCDLEPEIGGGDPLHGTLTANLNYGANSFNGFGSKNITGFAAANMRFYPADNGVGLEYFVGPVGSGARFQTIQSAIDAAVTAGAAFANPFNIYVLAGVYNEDVQLKAGIFLVGAGNKLGVKINGSVTADSTAAAITACGLSGITVTTDVAGKSAVQILGANGVGLYINDCYISGLLDSTVWAVAMNGTSVSDLLQINNTTIFGRGKTILTSSGTLQILNSLVYAKFAGGPMLSCNGTVYARATLFEQQTASSGVGINVAAGTTTLIDCDVHTIDGNSDGTFVANGATLNVYYTALRVPAGAANNAIGGAAGATLLYTGISLPTNNKVATTTIGAGATHVTLDNITAT